MRVFVTGGTGFIGAHLVVELLKGGDEVTLFARDPGKIPAFRTMPGVSFIEGSLDDERRFLSSLSGHDACIHNALYWEDAPTELQLKDTRAAVSLFAAAGAAGVGKLLYTSSTAVHRPFRSQMDEETRICPSDYYGASKACAETFLFAISHQFDMHCNIVRPGPTVDAAAVVGAPVKADPRLLDLIKAARRHEDLRVPRYEGRQLIGAADLAKVYSAILHSDVNRQTYLAVATNFTTWEQIAWQVVNALGANSQVVAEDGGAPMEPPMFSASKIEREFGLTFESHEALRRHVHHLVATRG